MTTQNEILERVLKDLRYYQQYGAKVILETAIFDLEHVIKEPPAQRKPWVGLTADEVWQSNEVMALNAEMGLPMNQIMALIAWANNILREKNNGTR